MATWYLVKIYSHLDELRLILGHPLADIPLTGLLEVLLWPGWPVIAAFSGVGLTAVGIGLLARHELARLLVAGGCVALLGGLILLWPPLLLAPPLVPAQLTLVFGLGLYALMALASLVRGLTHPQFRRYYLADRRSS